MRDERSRADAPDADRRGRFDERSPACAPGCACACAVGNEFGERQARRDLALYRRRGPDRTTGWLIEGLTGGASDGVDGLSVLDIGAGVGAVHLELLRAGASSATDVDGSPAYQAVARGEAARQGVGDRVAYALGDFVEVARTIEPADLVALDRVVCCYPDMEALVRLSVGRARRRYGLVYPRDTRWIRAASRMLNMVSRLLRRRFRTWVHRTADVDAIARAAGFAPQFERTTLFWQVVVYERP
ncbi:MAG TPA: methyltransferase domain-containing protein [Candidatus Limnocylindrales bacterium]|nr:methyltransferase domain-containing protein [Candidatus Limnocylindrales bacterium]